MNSYPGANIYKLEGDYDDLVKTVFELSESNENLINRLVLEEDISFVPRLEVILKRSISLLTTTNLKTLSLL